MAWRYLSQTGDYEYSEKNEVTFYDPAMASKELVDELYETVNVRIKAVKIIALAKSAIGTTWRRS